MALVPFDIDVAMTHIREGVKRFPKAAMFALAEAGFATPFQQLVACMISIRTRDEASLPISIRLFEAAPSPETVTALSIEQIDALIAPSTFHERKAVQIKAVAKRVMTEYGGELPCDEAVLRSFAGVGVKCANLALGIACIRRGLPVRLAGRVGAAGDPAAEDGTAEGRVIAVDIHVHRVTNRWGYVSTRTPEQTTQALAAVLPPRYDVEINELLVPFGKHICTGVRPKCSTCPVLDMCAQAGVTSHR